MFDWLLGKSPIQKAIEDEDYPKAMKLIKEEIERDPRPVKVRPLRQKMAECLEANGQTDAAIMTLRTLMKEYTDEGNNAKAIAIHKYIVALKSPEEEELEKVAAAMAAAPRAIELAAMDEEVSPISDRSASRIARSQLFGALEKDAVRALIQGMKLQNKRPGDLIMVEGEPGDSLFVLTDGSVRVHVKNASGRSTSIRDMEGGSFFGEISIVYGQPRTATITCATECELLELSRASLDAMSGSHPSVSKVLKDFCDQRQKSREEMEGRQRA
ncbi:MAG: cyclic nucleotide-binding domain-containing protein [Acidobacteriota bacterium]